MDKAPDELISRFLSPLSALDIVRSRAVCKTWSNVIKSSLALQYIVWLAISGESNDLITEELQLGASIPSDLPSPATRQISTSERLARLLELESAWTRGVFSDQRDGPLGAHPDPSISVESLRLRGHASAGRAAHASVISRTGLQVGLYPLSGVTSSLEGAAVDGHPPTVVLPALASEQEYIDCQDLSQDLLVTRTVVLSTDGNTRCSKFNFVTLSDPSNPHPLAPPLPLGHDDSIKNWMAGDFILHGPWFASRGLSNGFLTSRIWNWQSGQEVQGLKQAIGDVTRVSAPVFVASNKFVACCLVHEEEDEEAGTFRVAVLKLFDIIDSPQSASRPGNADHTTNGLCVRHIGNYELPGSTGDIELESTYAISRPTRATFEAEESEGKNEPLCHMSITGYSREHGFTHTYGFFFYPSALLRHSLPSGRQNLTVTIEWPDWGAEHCACFAYPEIESRMEMRWYVRGDRIVVVEREHDASDDVFGEDSDAEEDALKGTNLRLRVLDFRPARVRRAAQLARGDAVWPLPPAGHSLGTPMTVEAEVRSYPRFHYGWDTFDYYSSSLPYIESVLLTGIRAQRVEVEADERHIILNKVLLPNDEDDEDDGGGSSDNDVEVLSF